MLRGAVAGAVTAAVAPCGTALTATQVFALARFDHQRVLVAFDADPAGQAATAAAYSLLSERFTELRADLPKRGDPAGLLQTGGPQALREALSLDRPLADAMVDPGLRYWRNKRDSAEACAAAVHDLAPTIARLRPGHDANRLKGVSPGQPPHQGSNEHWPDAADDSQPVRGSSP